MIWLGAAWLALAWGWLAWLILRGGHVTEWEELQARAKFDAAMNRHDPYPLQRKDTP